DARRLAALAAADAAARGSLESMQRRYALGAAGYIELLIAEQQSQQTRIDLIEARSRRLIDSAALYQAMGGGRSGDGEDVAMSSPTDKRELNVAGQSVPAP
ncbi:MAG: TolC family protein, partial [Desulfurivibrionaceae bacterium]|nr:TolC family protein [Desulfurivibrionaceae bacterium]